MDVREILDLAAQQSVGLESPTALDQSVYLKYLNLVHAELYRKTAPINPQAEMVTETHETPDGSFKPQGFPVIIRSVYVAIANNPLILKPITYDKILAKDPEMLLAGQPRYWFFLNKKIQTYPKQENTFKIIYVKEPDPLTIETLSEQIPYPPLYHQVLIDGTCYYLFQGETGMKNKEELTLALNKWERGRQELYSYLMNLSGTNLISTFSEV